MRGFSTVLAVAAFVVSTQAQAEEYQCGAWSSTVPGTQEIETISILKSMVIYKEGGPNVTARMFFGTLDQTTYLTEESAIVLYGDRVRDAEGAMVFTDTIVVQRLYYDVAAPRITQATCRITQ